MWCKRDSTGVATIIDSIATYVFMYFYIWLKIALLQYHLIGFKDKICRVTFLVLQTGV